MSPREFLKKIEEETTTGRNGWSIPSTGVLFFKKTSEKIEEMPRSTEPENELIDVVVVFKQYNARKFNPICSEYQIIFWAGGREYQLPREKVSIPPANSEAYMIDLRVKKVTVEKIGSKYLVRAMVGEDFINYVRFTSCDRRDWQREDVFIIPEVHEAP